MDDSVEVAVTELEGDEDSLGETLPLKLVVGVNEPLRVRVAVRETLADLEIVADPLLDIVAL